MTDELIEQVKTVLADASGGWLTDAEQDEIARAALAAINLPARLEAARTQGWNEAIEAAAAYVDGKGGTVIPGATVFAALVSGNFQPCMSGDARDRLHPHIRRRFDAATHTLTRDIRALTKDSTHD